MYKAIILFQIKLFNISTYRRARRGGCDDRFRDDKGSQFSKNLSISHY